MKTFSLLQTTLVLTATAAITASQVASAATILNIDFLANRGGEAVSPNYVGVGAAGGGTVFNGLLANDAAGGDNITVAGSDLEDSSGVPTDFGFTLSYIGADNQGPHNENSVLNGGYLFINSANNGVGTASFTFSGLTPDSTADIFFITNNNDNVLPDTFTLGGTEVTYTSTSIFNSGNTLEFDNVPVSSSGKITGTFGDGTDLGIFSGISIEGTVPSVSSVVPEPTTGVLAGLGLGALLLLQRARSRRQLS